MKTAIKAALAAMMMFAVVAVSAQPQSKDRTPEERAKMMTDRLKKELSLTDQQADMVMKLNLKSMQEKMPKDSASIKKMWDWRMAEMKKILTPEQYQKWSMMQKEKMNNMTPEQMIDKRVQMMKMQLGLNDQQTAQIKKWQMDMWQMRQDDMAKWKEQMATEDAQMKNILTPDQYQKWMEWKKAQKSKDMKKGPNKSKSDN